MKLGLLAVLAVAVLVPSLSESRIVSKCELKDQLSKAIKLPARLEKHREAVLERVTYSVYRKSGLNTSLVRVFGKRITTTAKPTTKATTPSTSGGNGTTTKEMTGPTDIQPATNESVTINPMTTNTGNGTNSSDGSRRKREANPSPQESGVEENVEEAVNVEVNIEDDEYQKSDMDEGDEEEEVVDEEEEVEEVEEEEEEEEVEEEEVEEEEEEEEEVEEEEVEEEAVKEEEEEGDEVEERVDNEEEEEGVDEDVEEVSDEEEEQGSEEEEINEEEVMDNSEVLKREKRSFHRRKPKQKQGLKPKLPWSIGFYGLFQLSDSYFCDSGYRWSINSCNTSCTAFTDDDISDDIACLVKTRRWRYLLRKARRYNGAKGFLEECN
ncbi:uncharacterized protein LOC127533171 [Acanthochromis polyacanthus]|uniref:uncharacterized protein LOC127533171 n=1 Tax=Acanthochromis polyacanthus TaxID=80966 RepID=UPI00223436BD|nr:uncharacterized protein LOC127533171 [Acanthochromis polyacanthus]